MKSYSRSHVADSNLRLSLHARVAAKRIEAAELLADTAEFDHRRLFAPEAYDSMFTYCVGEFQMSDDIALKWIRAARAAQRFPILFEAVADGRLHLSAVGMLKRHLTTENVEELVAAATRKSKSEIKAFLDARGRSQSESPCLELAVELAPGPVRNSPESAIDGVAVHSQLAPGLVGAVETPPAPLRYPIQLSVEKEVQDDLRYLQALLGHRVPGGDVAQIFGQALKAYITQIERRKFGATLKPRKSRGSSNPRYVPTEVRRAVWLRDEGQCTFVSATGRRCESRDVEFDHILPVARGGDATVANLRLLCRTHNQHAAERSFGTEFMRLKREGSAERSAGVASQESPSEAGARSEEPAKYSAIAANPAPSADMRPSLANRIASARAGAAAAAEQALRKDGVFKALRGLGYKVEEAREAARFCEDIADAPLEDQVKVALQYFHSKQAPGTPPARAAHAA